LCFFFCFCFFSEKSFDIATPPLNTDRDSNTQNEYSEQKDINTQKGDEVWQDIPVSTCNDNEEDIVNLWDKTLESPLKKQSCLLPEDISGEHYENLSVPSEEICFLDNKEQQESNIDVMNDNQSLYIQKGLDIQANACFDSMIGTTTKPMTNVNHDSDQHSCSTVAYKIQENLKNTLKTVKPKSRLDGIDLDYTLIGKSPGRRECTLKEESAPKKSHRKSKMQRKKRVVGLVDSFNLPVATSMSKILSWDCPASTPKKMDSNNNDNGMMQNLGSKVSFFKRCT